MGRKENRRLLAEAQAEGAVVGLRRSAWKADHLEGFVVAVGREWAVLHLVWEVRLNGWAAVRLDTVRSVAVKDADDFVPRALALIGDRPVPVPVDPTSVRTVLESAAHRFPLLTVHKEVDDPDVCWIGRPQRVGARRLHLHEISSDARWLDVRSHALDDVTRVDVGGAYEQALHGLGGFPPLPD